MSLPLTAAAITDCREHLNQHPDTDPAVSAYLTRYVNGLMCAEIESVVTSLIRERLGKGCSDQATFNFVRSVGRSTIRNAKVSEIRSKVALLGNVYKTSFNDLVEQKLGEEGIEKLGLTVRKRDQNAHETPPDITFRELEEVFDIATDLVDVVRLTLKR